MKTSSNYLLIFFVMLALVAGCSVSEKAVKKDYTAKKKELQTENLSLADLLRRQPELQVTGSGNNAQVILRGVNNPIGIGEPLFVYDDVTLGKSFQSAVDAVDVSQIASIKVLRSAQGLIYGRGGANGVIVITSKGKEFSSKERKKE